MLEMPVVNGELCNLWCLCVEVCRCGALVLVGDSIVVVETAECGYCTECEVVCPTGAIRCPYEIIIEEYQ